MSVFAIRSTFIVGLLLLTSGCEEARYELDELESEVAAPALTRGLTAEYFDSQDFSAPVLERVDAMVGFDWGTGSPAAAIGVDTFSVRWSGWLTASKSELFTVYTLSDDGVRLWLNDRLVIDHWSVHAAAEDRTTFALTVGVPVRVRLEYFEAKGTASMKLAWSSATVAKTVIPSSALLPLGGVVVSKPLALNAGTLQAGVGTLSGTVTYLNTGAAAVTLKNVVLTSRRPGATHAGGPYDDLAPRLVDRVLQPGESVALAASRPLTLEDPTGIWEAYSTYESSAGAWVDAAPGVAFTVEGGAPSVRVPPSASCFPFSPSSLSDLRASPRKVFAHYFSPYPLSLDNADPATDYYQRNYLQPSGEAGKFAFCGGMLKQRPLPQPPRLATVDWQLANLQEEVRRAIAIGIDGFTYDMLSTSGRHWDLLLKLLEAAKTVDPAFRIVLMPDMTSTFKGTDPDAQVSFVAAIGAVASHPSVYRSDDGRVVIAPFGADRRTPTWWASALSALASQKGIRTALWPTFVSPWVAGTDALAAQVPLYGTSTWGPRTLNGALNLVGAAGQAHARNMKWLAPVAPQDSRPKDLVYTEANNSQAMRALWDAAIRGGADAVQLITWNDYSEATEFSPSTGTQWAVFDLTAFYIQWFKSGAAPAINRDALYYFHRNSSTEAKPDLTRQSAPYRAVNGPAGVNEIELLAFLTAPATLEIQLGGTTRRQDFAAGIQSFRVPLVEGTPAFRIVRAGQVVAQATSGFQISNTITYQDMLYRAGGSITCDRSAYFR